VLDELAKSGMDHVKIDSRNQHVSGVRKEDVHEFFEGFQVDQVGAHGGCSRRRLTRDAGAV
jgi:hypothetical protein